MKWSKIYILCSHETNTLIKCPFSLLQHIINTNFQYFLLSKVSMHQNKSVIPTKEHSNHYLQNVFISTVTTQGAQALICVIIFQFIYFSVFILPFN